MKNYLQRFKNPGTIVSLVGLIGVLLNQLGFMVDLEGLGGIVNTVCSILIVLGICNNPTTNGIDIPKNNKIEG